MMELLIKMALGGFIALGLSLLGAPTWAAVFGALVLTSLLALEVELSLIRKRKP